MVSTRPRNKLKKIPDGTFIDLSEKRNPKTTTRRRIVMEDEGGSQPEKNVEGSSSPRDESPLEQLAGAAEFDILEGVDEEKDAEGEGTPTVTLNIKQEKTSSTKKKVPKLISPKKGGGNSSRSGSSPGQVAGEKKASVGGSSNQSEEEQEVDSGRDETKDDDETYEERPTKKQKAEKKVVEKGKKPMLRAREEKTLNNVANREIVVPKRIDFELLGELGLAEGVKEKFKAIGWESFLEWDTASYEELVKEFYSDLQVKIDKEGLEYLEFKLRGVERRVKMDDLNVALKMVE